ncbi:MAG: kynureninase [Flammeovirgaceae bacterium]
MEFESTKRFAEQLDQQDELKKYRAHFYFPQHEGSDCLYFCGNSLGLQPKQVKDAVMVELEDWEKFGVEGHFQGRNPWFHYHKFLNEPTARLVGAKPSEVVVMNSLTVNLHLMLTSFYRPSAQRFKIIVEGDCFPSDHYAVCSQAALHGYEPDEAIVELWPRAGEYTLRTADILQKIEEIGDELALVMLGGVNYYTGQLFDMKAITAKAHEVGAKAGYDLAHAAGNVSLALHDWNVDFAVWCSYKYLNSGPGGTSGVFVHERYAEDPQLLRMAGWWGHNEEERFLMEKGFEAMKGAAGWQLSNAQILPMAVHKASLSLFDEVGMEALVNKSRKLTGFLEYLIQELNQEQDQVRIQIITPKQVEERGCQLSLVLSHRAKEIHQAITKQGVVADWREPDVIRVAPVPLYNSFVDVYGLYEALKTVITAV